MVYSFSNKKAKYSVLGSAFLAYNLDIRRKSQISAVTAANLMKEDNICPPKYELHQRQSNSWVLLSFKCDLNI